MAYDNILDKVYETPWLITQEGMDLILSIVDRRIHNGERLTEEELGLFLDLNKKKNEGLELPTTPSIATLPVQGSIFPKANLFSALSGGTSLDKLSKDFNTLMESDMVTGILLDMDTPGGSASMVKEMADLIWEARQQNKKPIYAIANGLSASAGYYLGSQADKLFVTPSGQVGSIGVIAAHRDRSEQEKNEGIKTTVLTVGDYKADGHPSIPLTDEAKQRVLEGMNETYTDFVNDVARGRGVTPEEVINNYGKGRVYHSRTALEKGMVDGVRTYDSVIKGMSKEIGEKPTPVMLRKPTQGVKAMAELTPETLELLGLSEDATDEEVTAAVIELHGRSDNSTGDPEPVVSDEFEKKFPEQAAILKKQNEELAELRAGRRKDAARMFASGYEAFEDDSGSKTGFGFSSLALEQVEEMHLKIDDGLVTIEDFEKFLDNIASGSAVVDYRELGSTRGEETDPETVSKQEAAIKLRDMALKLQTEEGMSYGDALAKVMKEHPKLAAIYNSIPNPEAAGGGEN